MEIISFSHSAPSPLLSPPFLPASSPLHFGPDGCPPIKAAKRGHCQRFVINYDNGDKNVLPSPSLSRRIACSITMTRQIRTWPPSRKMPNRGRGRRRRRRSLIRRFRLDWKSKWSGTKERAAWRGVKRAFLGCLPACVEMLHQRCPLVICLDI